MVKIERTEQEEKLWRKIKKNMKEKYELGLINNMYTYKEFCNDFVADMDATEDKTSDECLCGHDIEYNYEYTHKEGYDTFILGSSCIETFSTENKKRNKELRTCLICKCKIKKCKTNMCTDCKEQEQYRKINLFKQRIYEKRITCQCGKPKKEDYKTCYDCYSEKNGIIIDNTKCKCGKTKDPKYRLCYQCNLKK